MNLYTENFTHYSEKGSESGISKYFLASSNLEALHLTNSYQHALEILDDMGDYTQDEIKRELAKYGGELYCDYIEKSKMLEYFTLNYDDLYYGLTYTGFKLVEYNISNIDIEVLTRLGILTTFNT